LNAILLPAAEEEWTRFYHGMLPFHCACRAGAPPSVLQWCVEKYPDAIQTLTTDTRDTPLHCYLSSWSSIPIALMIPATTTSHWEMTQKAKRKKSFKAVQFLIKKHEAALHSPNREGFLPLHVAAMCDAPLDILFHLAHGNPQVLVRN